MPPSPKLTPAQGLEALRQESLKLLMSFARSTQEAAMYNWDRERNTRAIHLISAIKRDLDDLNRRLTRITNKHSKLSGKVLAHPHHPEMLKAGGEYIGFIDDATNLLTPMISEIMELMADQSSDKEPTNT